MSFGSIAVQKYISIKILVARLSPISNNIYNGRLCLTFPLLFPLQLACYLLFITYFRS